MQTRSKRWVQVLAGSLARAGISPNGVSVLGMVFAVAGCGALLSGWWWAAAAAVQLRLLCNLLDGLIAVEHGKGDKLGVFFNEVPDRFADVVLLLAAGYAAGRGGAGATGATLGWAASVLAVGTAYLRQTGGAMGLPQDFCGPMAKQHRMFVLTVSLLAAGLVEATVRPADPDALRMAQAVLRGGLWVIVTGTAVTVARRALRLTEALKRR